MGMEASHAHHNQAQVVTQISSRPYKFVVQGDNAIIGWRLEMLLVARTGARVLVLL